MDRLEDLVNKSVRDSSNNEREKIDIINEFERELLMIKQRDGRISKLQIYEVSTRLRNKVKGK